MADAIVPSQPLSVISREDAKSSGYKRYFTGIVCAQGHLAERFVKSSACCVCSKQATDDWRKNNRDRLREQDKIRRERDPYRCTKYKQDWKVRNKDKVREGHKRYAEKNREKILSRAKEFRQKEENKNKSRKALNDWRKNNPGKASAQVSARRSARINATPPWADKRAILAMYESAVKSGMTVDHIIPLNHPLVCGLHVHQNMQLLTPSENSIKGNKFSI